MLKTVLSEVTGAAVLFSHFFGQLSRKVTALFVSFITFHISSHQVVLPLQELRVTCGCIPPSHSTCWGLENAWGCLQPRACLFLSQCSPSLPLALFYVKQSYCFCISRKGQQQLWICCASVSKDSGELPGPGAAAHWRHFRRHWLPFSAEGMSGREKGWEGEKEEGREWKEGAWEVEREWKEPGCVCLCTMAGSSHPIQNCIPQVGIQAAQTLKDSAFPRERERLGSYQSKMLQFQHIPLF